MSKYAIENEPTYCSNVKENEKERKVLMHEFQMMYKQMRKRRHMGKRLYFSVYGNNVMGVFSAGK